jgi:hypothetical protein
MNNYLRKLMALAFFAVALMGAALAQDTARMVRANIPFSFYAGDQLMPAGEYTIAVNVEDHLVAIGQAASGHRSFLLGSSDDDSRDNRTVLTFKLVAGDVYALRELQGPDLGLSFSSKAPQAAMSAQNQGKESVTIIAEAK